MSVNRLDKDEEAEERRSASRPFTGAASIRQQQSGAGHEACFATDRRYSCAESDCRWRPDCIKLRAAWRR